MSGRARWPTTSKKVSGATPASRSTRTTRSTTSCGSTARTWRHGSTRPTPPGTRPVDRSEGRLGRDFETDPADALRDAGAVEAEAGQDVVRPALGEELARDAQDARRGGAKAGRLDLHRHGVDEERAGPAVADAVLRRDHEP